MDISTKLATDILVKMKEIINQDLNYINTNGIIIASTNPDRIGNFHEASLLCVKKEKEVIIENDEQYIGSKKGINMPIYFDDSIIGVIGITGEKDEVEKYGEIIRMMTSILIKEAWIKDQDVRKREIIKAFIERIILEYDHDIYPMNNFTFPYIVIVGTVDKSNFLFLDDKITNTLRDYFAYDKRIFYTISRNEIIILYHYYKGEDIFSSIENLQSLILKKFNLLIKFGIGSDSINYQELKSSYKNAKEILKISTIFSTKKSVFDYNKMDLELLFLNLKKNAIENFKNKILENISEKDFEEFSNILTVYEQENGSVIYTAEKLFMHKNTLQYKLNKIKRLSGYDPRNLKDFTILSLAFKLKNLE